MDWLHLYSFASKQALLGLCFEGIERLGKEYPEELKLNPIGRELLMNWMGKAQQIHRQNMKVNVVAGKLFSMLREETAPTRCSELLRSKVGRPKRSSPDCAGWDRRGKRVYS